jgi:hypothetical protein
MNKQMYYHICTHYWGATCYVSDSLSVLRRNFKFDRVEDCTGLVEIMRYSDYEIPQDGMDVANSWHDKYEAMGYIDADTVLY